MLIVLEGERRSGKSTIANILKKAMPHAMVIHCTQSTPNDFNFFSEIIRASYNKTIICDRFCYAQFAYQDEADRKLSKEMLHKLEIKMLDAGTSIIYVKADPYTIVRRIEATGKDSYIGDKSVADVCEAFDKIFKESLLPVQVYNTATNK